MISLSYLSELNAYIAEVDVSLDGHRSRILRLYTGRLLERFTFLFPPMRSKRRFVAFIGATTVKVRRFIRNRRRLIEVLNEQKQAIINRAVTRGLDPNVPLKPSGIDWLGDIPEHWKASRLKHLCRVFGQQCRKH